MKKMLATETIIKPTVIKETLRKIGLLPSLVTATMLVATPAAMAKTQQLNKQLNKSMIRQMVTQTAAMVNNKNIDGFSKYLSHDVRIHVDITMNGQTTPFRLNKQQYMSQAKATLSNASHYRYSVKIKRIDIQGDRAYVDSLVVEKLTISGVPMVSEASERTTVKLINGKPKVTRIEGKAQVKVSQ